MKAAASEPVARQAAIGLGLAAAIVLAWLATMICGVFLFRIGRDPAALALLLIGLQSWLNVGLFIVAHDAMHGSLAPFRPRLNRAVGRLCLALYAGFSYDRLIRAHMAHHRHAGGTDDPDFHAADPHRFWPWYATFMRTYFGWREFGILAAIAALAVGVLRVRPENALVFWALPAVASSVQLFYFGTYLPHRHKDAPFRDRHNARSNAYSWPVSLLTCFHFGYHHEHHAHPGVPWWRLPRVRAALTADSDGTRP
jgi:beta-carotene/zeaxanthin 4-ketolase